MEEIFIKESDLLDTSSPLNERLYKRHKFIKKFLFKDKKLNDFVTSLQNLRKITRKKNLKSVIDLVFNQVIFHLFITHKLSVDELADLFAVPRTHIAWILLGKFEKIKFDIKLFSFFQLDDLSTENTGITIQKLKDEMSWDLKESDICSDSDKVTLNFFLESHEWDRILLNHDKVGSDTLTNENNNRINGGFRLLISYILLSLVMSLLLFLILKIHVQGQEDLISKIKVPSRFFTWLDKDDFYPTNLIVDNSGDRQFENSAEEVNEQFRLEGDRFEVESDVTIASLDEINLDEFESYEEEKKGGFRDTRYGSKKVYRVMIKSADLIQTGFDIDKIMKENNVVKGGNVEPGSKLPGGLYYNLLVPNSALKKFISNLDSNSDLNIYLSKSKLTAPKGKTNVFLWVKKI